MRTSRWIAAVLFAAGLVAVIEAQPPGGRGGFGGGGGVTALVLSNDALQAELKVTGEQKDKLKPLTDRQKEMGAKMTDALKSAAGDREKMQELFAEMRKDGEQLQADVKKAVDDTLTADQKKRLKQIERQQAGVRALQAEDVVAGLKLTDEQKGKVKGVADDLGKDMREIFGGGGKGGGKGFDPAVMAETQKKIEKLNKAAMAEVDEVLTDEQKKAWKEMVGAPFDTTKLTQGFGFGGGGAKGKGKGKTKD